MANYFNTLNLRQQLAQLGKCRFMARDEFADGASYLQGKKVVIVGCGAQGLNQGLNMRDSGLDISYALRKEAIAEKRASWRKATENGFKVGTYEELIPQADLVVNLTPDKQHSDVVRSVQPLMKDGAALGYSHGFNIVEVGEQIRKDITVVMVAPKCPGTEVREEYKRGFGVPTLIAVHPENDPKGEGMAIAKAWAAATGGHRAGGRANHPLRHAAGGFSAVLRQAGGGRYRSGVCRKTDSVRLGNHHRSAEAGRHHPDDGSPL